MADDSQHDAGSTGDTGRARRAPPTIDLEATEVTTAPQPDAGESAAEPESDKVQEPGETKEQPAEAASPSSARSISPWVIAPFSGAAAAALVIAIGWMLGWPPVEAPTAAPQVKASVVDDLAARVAGLESKVGKPSADPAMAARTDALEKSIPSLRGDLGNLRAQSDKLAAALGALKAAPQASGSPVDLSGINDRIAELERTVRAQGAQIAQEGEKIAASKAADDLPLRRLVAASLLDVAVRHGDPYQTLLATAKSLSANADDLKPLDTFAATGVPTPFALNRELLTLVPKLSPAPPEDSTASTGIMDRLKAGATKLVRIERTDAVGNDRSAVVARVTAAALHNDLADARRELGTLSPSDRAPAQAWLDKAEARDAALAASRQYADQTMAALAKSGQ